MIHYNPKNICLTSLIVLFLMISGHVLPQRGYPFLKNFYPKEYNSHPQNFNIMQGESGLMYFANFAGILEFDGNNWKTISTYEKTKINSFAFFKSKIFVGARGEIGYLAVDANSSLVWFDLTAKIPVANKNFLDVIATFESSKKILFFTKAYIFKYFNGEIEVHNIGDELLKAYKVNTEIFVLLKSKGLCLYKDKQFIKVSEGEKFSDIRSIQAILELGKDFKIIASDNSGLFKMSGNGIESWQTQADFLFKKNIITCGVRLSNNLYAFGTNRIGIIVIDENGNLIQVIDKTSGLQNENINKLFVDNYQNLWVALNNGITLIETPSPLSYYDEKSGINGQVTDIARMGNNLYVSTLQGVYKYDGSKDKFISLKDIYTSCYDLESDGGKLYAATSNGLYSIYEQTVTRIDSGYCLSIFITPELPGKTYTGRLDGIYIQDGKSTKRINGIDAEIRNIVFLNNKLWLETASSGIFSFSPSDKQFNHYDTTNGMPSLYNNHLNVLGNELIVSTIKGLLKYSNNSFEKFHLNKKDTSSQTNWYYSIIEDEEGNIWFTKGDQTHLTMIPKNSDDENFKLTFEAISEFTCSFIKSDNNITWAGGADGLLKFDPTIKKDFSKNFLTLIRNVTISEDSLLFGGYLKAGETVVPQIKYLYNKVVFDFSSPTYDFKNEAVFQYYLEGFEKTWNNWTSHNHKEYTNLSKGDYTFYVRSKDIYGNIGKEAKYHFKILAPWYNTVVAYVFYLLLAIGIIYLFVKWRSQKLIKEKKQLEEIINERTEEIVNQKEEIEKQSEALFDKNAELEKINKLVKSINSEIQFSNLLNSILDKLRVIRGVERATALVWDKNQQVFKVKAGFGWDISLVENLQLTLEQSEKRYLTNSEEVYEDVFIKTSFNFYEAFEILERLDKPKSMVVLVIKVDNKVEGYLILENMIKENAFSTKDFSFIRNSKEHIISAFIKTKILEDLQLTFQNLKDTQVQLIQQEKLASLGQLTAGIAHEIKNPLNFINNFSSLCVELSEEVREILDGIKEKIPEDEYADIDEVIGMIESNAKKINEHGGRADRIVKGMLQHSRGDSNEFQLTDINGLVKEYMNLAYHGVRAENKEFNTALKTDLDTSLDKINIVPQDLSRVILNIVNNACFAVNDKKLKLNDPLYAPEIFVSTRKEKNNVVIRIKDNGVGMPDNVKEKIFNPFFTTKPTGKGTGLGLSMSFDIVTQIHKGKLQVETVDGESTEFILSIPLNLSSTES